MGVNGNCILRGLYQLQLVTTYYTPRAPWAQVPEERGGGVARRGVYIYLAWVYRI